MDGNTRFLGYQPPLSPARLQAMTPPPSGPLFTAKQRVIEQDPVSGLITAGERVETGYTDRVKLGPLKTKFAPTEAERLAATQARQHAAVLTERDRRQAAGLDIYGVGRVDVSDRGLLYLAGLSQAAGDAMMAGQPFLVTINLHSAGSATMDGPQTKTTALVALAYINALFGHARDLDAAIDAASTAEDVAGINVLDNWPPDQPRDPATGQFVASTGA